MLFSLSPDLGHKLTESVAINALNGVGYAVLRIPRSLNQFQMSCHGDKSHQDRRSTLYIYSVSVCRKVSICREIKQKILIGDGFNVNYVYILLCLLSECQHWHLLFK